MKPRCCFQVSGLRWGQRGIHEDKVAGIPRIFFPQHQAIYIEKKQHNWAVSSPQAVTTEETKIGDVIGSRESLGSSHPLILHSLIQ